MATEFSINELGVSTPVNRAWIWGPAQLHPASVLWNTSSTTIFLSDQGLPLVDSGVPAVPLRVGETLPWDEDVPLFVATERGVAKLVVLENSGQPSVSHGVGVSDLSPVPMEAFPAHYPLGSAPNFTFDLEGFGYYSLGVSLNPDVLSPTDFSTTSITVDWLDGYGGIIDSTWHDVYSQSTGESLFITGPAVTSTMRVWVGLSPTQTGLPEAMFVSVSVTGLDCPAPKRVWRQQLGTLPPGAGWSPNTVGWRAQGGAVTFNRSMAANESQKTYPPFAVGPATIYLANMVNLTAPIDLTFTDANGEVFYVLNLPNGYAGQGVPIANVLDLPDRPFSVTAHTFAACTMRASIVCDRSRDW
jgi:hypothetical protein